MIKTLATIFGTEVLKIILANNLKKINLEMFHFEKDEMNKFKNDFSKHYGNHFKEICKWAESIPFIGLAKPKNT